MKKNETEETGFSVEIKYNGNTVIAQVMYSFPLTEEEKKIYKMEDGDFLVSIDAPEGRTIFRIFLDEYGQWRSDASEITVDKALVEQTGQAIESFLE